MVKPEDRRRRIHDGPWRGAAASPRLEPEEKAELCQFLNANSLRSQLKILTERGKTVYKGSGTTLP